MSQWWIAVALLVVLMGAVVLALRRRGAKEREPLGFREAVRHPDRFVEEVEVAEREREEIEAEDLDDDAIARCVEDLLHPPAAARARARLEHRGEPAVPFLIEALGDERFRNVRYEGYQQTAFATVVRLLRPHAPAAAVPPLTSLVGDEDEVVRKQAALLLGAIGQESCLEPLTRALGDDDGYVRHHAMIGVLEAMEAKRASRAFLDSIFEHLVPLLRRRDDTVSGHAPGLLLAISRGRALSAFLAGGTFHVDNPELYHILRAANRARAALPGDRILALLDELRPRIDKHPHDRAYGGALVALAVARHPRAQEKAREAIESPKDCIRQSAAEALAVASGLPDVHAYAFDALETAGDDPRRLAPAVRSYLLVRFLIDEVENGGYTQYFFNSSSDHARETLEAAREIGANALARQLERRLRLFGPNGPSSDRDERMRQLAAIADRMDELDDAGGETGSGPREGADTRAAEDPEVLLYLYAIRHKEDFGAR